MNKLAGPAFNVEFERRLNDHIDQEEERAKADAVRHALDEKRVESTAISVTVVGLVTRGVIQNKPKCIAVQAWVNALWAEYYIRKASGSDDMNFASVGAMPYTVPELAAELA